VRVVADTNGYRKQAMAAGRFREDLYDRLGVMTLPLPPLRERGADTLLLAMALLQRYAVKSQHKVRGFSRHALSALQSYGWPGNVRELENRLKQAVLMTQGPQVALADLDLDAPYSQSLALGTGLREACEAFEEEFIQRARAKHDGNISRTASALGVSCPTQHDLVTKYALESQSGGSIADWVGGRAPFLSFHTTRRTGPRTVGSCGPLHGPGQRGNVLEMGRWHVVKHHGAG
jgi:two-component system NtrC family response regulator